MLKGHALEYYYNSKLSEKLFNNAYNYMQNFFKRAEYYRKNLTK